MIKIFIISDKSGVVINVTDTYTTARYAVAEYIAHLKKVGYTKKEIMEMEIDIIEINMKG